MKNKSDNLTRDRLVKRTKEYPLLLNSLPNLSKVPTKRQVKFAFVLFIYILTNTIKRQVIGRYLGLYESFKAKTGRLTTIVNELRSLWNKLNFPCLLYTSPSPRD